MFSKPGFYRKENLKKCTSFEEQKGTRYIRGNVYFGIIIFGCLSSTKSCLRFLLICFNREIKGFYQSPLAKNLNLKKLRHDFVDERAMITTTLISSYHWKILVPFFLRKIKLENAFLTLTVNYRKIVQKDKLCHPKQQQISYLMIYEII